MVYDPIAGRYVYQSPRLRFAFPSQQLLTNIDKRKIDKIDKTNGTDMTTEKLEKNQKNQKNQKIQKSDKTKTDTVTVTEFNSHSYHNKCIEKDRMSQATAHSVLLQCMYVLNNVFATTREMYKKDSNIDTSSNSNANSNANSNSINNTSSATSTNTSTNSNTNTSTDSDSMDSMGSVGSVDGSVMQHISNISNIQTKQVDQYNQSNTNTNTNTPNIPNTPTFDPLSLQHLLQYECNNGSTAYAIERLLSKCRHYHNDPYVMSLMHAGMCIYSVYVYV